MNSRAAVKTLLAFALGLPLVLAVLGWVVGLLTAMGDSAAATVLGHINTGASVVWLLSIVGLVIALAVETLDSHEGEE